MEIAGSQHVSITTPHKESQPHKAREDQSLLFRIASRRTQSSNWKNPNEENVSPSNVKSTSNLKTDEVKELSLKGDTQGV